MKMTPGRFGTGLAAVALGIYALGVQGGDAAMKNVAPAALRPPIDRAVPARLETATFGLG